MVEAYEAPTGRHRTGPVRRYLDGTRLLWRGLRLCLRSPRLLLLGLIPVVIAALIFAALFGVLIYFLGDLASAVTWFADEWSETGRTVVRVLAGIALLGGAALLGLVLFTAFTLTIGDPFYERISKSVEDSCGGAPDELDTGFWRSLGRDIVDSAAVMGIAVLVAPGLFCAGFLPVAGQTVVPVVGATVGGWFLAMELVGNPFSRRGLRLRDRWRALRAHRATALGFGTAVFGCFALIPGGAILLMPAAVAGGTLLARQALGLPVTVPPAVPPAAGAPPPGTSSSPPR